ncbi:MAG TPA: hypothetical protein VNT79_08030 [Phycisphaerae bacterium]|nr:hypothetical protein [Phycisphaerae bacterium]
MKRSRPSAYNTRSYGGLDLRTEQIRRAMPAGFSGDRLGLLAPSQPLIDPVYASLHYRNLLHARSPLASRSMSLVGRQDYVIRDGEWAGALNSEFLPYQSALARTGSALDDDATKHHDPIPTGAAGRDLGGPSLTPLNDLLEARIRERAEAYRRRGVEYFRQGDYLSASQYLELHKYSNPDDSQAYVALLLVAFQQEDVNQTIVCLTHALQRMTRLEDVWLDWREFYEDGDAFAANLERLSIAARGHGSSPHSSLIVGYFQWIHGDISEALVYIDIALTGFDALARVEEQESGQISEIDRAAHIRRFRDLLAAEKQAAPEAGNGAPSR